MSPTGESGRETIPENLFNHVSLWRSTSITIGLFLAMGSYCVFHFSVLKMPMHLALFSALCFGAAITLVLHAMTFLYFHAVALAEKLLYLQSRQ